MTLGTLLLIVLVIALLGGFGGASRYDYNFALPGGILGVLLIVLLVLIVLGRV